MEQAGTDRSADFFRWLVEQWKASVTLVLESMTGDRPEFAEAHGPPEPAAPEEGAIWWEQTLSLAPEPAVWVGAPIAAWKELGSRTLRAAGLEEPSPDEVRSTFMELLGQSLSGWAGSVRTRANGEVSCAGGTELAGPPADVLFDSVALRMPDAVTIQLRIGFSPSLVETLAPQSGRDCPEAPAVGRASGVQPSKTLDLLLDVELPVSVSFGRTEMPLQDILKLTAGSIVELNRSIHDPVELIVNNCVVALGEVVVIEGNYGVRIRRIASREKRMWTSDSGREGN